MTGELIMGIDTSNYTTSVALITPNGELVANIKFPLPVKAGERGLRQSDAVFAHVKNLPLAMVEAKKYLSGNKLVAVAASERPRNVDGSYMPCFLCGIGARDSIAAATAVPSYSFSHQCGHIMAALYSAGEVAMLSDEFVAFHISGGTTEMLSVKGKGDSFDAEIIGGSDDLNAGQVIDRIGVYMSLSFPAGREMERLALSNTKKIPSKKPKINGLSFNLSGLENLAISLFEKTNDKELTAAFVFDYISKCLVGVCENYEAQNGKTRFVFSGGVMSNSIIKDTLSKSFDAVFAEPALSADNAVGIAALALEAYKRRD
ncbi:MAG: peptidase M22 [Clostridia bacterium]|nr:peptidase M22 [Clostridia bacterium]